MENNNLDIREKAINEIQCAKANFENLKNQVIGLDSHPMAKVVDFQIDEAIKTLESTLPDHDE